MELIYQKAQNISFFFERMSISSVQFSHSVMSDSLRPHGMPGHIVYHQPLELTQSHVHQVSDDIQPSHPLSSPFPPAPNPSQNQSLFQSSKSSCKRKSTAIQSYLKKQEKHQTDNVTLHIKLEKRRTTKKNQKERNHKDLSRNK